MSDFLNEFLGPEGNFDGEFDGHTTPQACGINHGQSHPAARSALDAKTRKSPENDDKSKEGLCDPKQKC